MSNSFISQPMLKTYFGISLDFSVSMRPHATAAMNDYNQTIKAIKDGSEQSDVDAIVTVVQNGVNLPGDYSHATVERAITNSSVNRLHELSEYKVSGLATPLFDSVGMLIDTLSAVPDANDPDVTFVINVVTDGQENSSKNWTGVKLAAKIAELQRTDRWMFIFRVPSGTESDLIKLGIHSGNVMGWDTNSATGMVASTAKTTQGISNYFTARRSGTSSTRSFFADTTQVDKAIVKATLSDVTSHFKKYRVTADHDSSQIRDFVTEMTGGYSAGCAFYELSKSEEVSDKKQIAIMEKATGKVYSGSQARQLLGLPSSGSIKLRPGTNTDFEIYIQSTSVNRKLLAGTEVLVMN